nr:Chain X, PROTEIN (PEPTIDE V108) [synthetic construct]1VPP_Y Chain Y, PROTEIN (PEPTIDE V108) [synthetic construct]
RGWVEICAADDYGRCLTEAQ